MTEQFNSGDTPNVLKSPVTTMIVFCHLRWDFVYQRPQHLLSRLAEHYRILVVEEPIYHEGAPFLKSYSPSPNITVYQPHTPVHAHGFHDDQIPLLQPLLADLVPSGENPIAWFYTPMALPLLQTVHPSLIVYDCMDELAAFKNAPKQLLQRESALLNMADVVFTGGPSLYEAKRERHANAHCFSSSVDLQHFSKALDRSSAHPSQANLRHPRLGYYGVIDERFDVDMLRAIADARPDWEIVMVGPVVKIDQAALPRNPNIHYMGQAAYDELPQYLAAWDVCLMPFALNDSTKFISPTKVLEYMAAELPIVSTNITDVTKPYSSIVAIAHSPEEFIRACDEALAMTHEQRAKMVEDMRAVVKTTSWAATANGMRSLMQAGVSNKKPGVMTELGSLVRVNSLPANSVQDYKSVSIGNGAANLAAAYHLDQDSARLGSEIRTAAGE